MNCSRMICFYEGFLCFWICLNIDLYSLSMFCLLHLQLVISFEPNCKERIISMSVSNFFLKMVFVELVWAYPFLAFRLKKNCFSDLFLRRCWILFICMKLIHLCFFFLIKIYRLFYSFNSSNGWYEMIEEALFYGRIDESSWGNARMRWAGLQVRNIRIDREEVTQNWQVSWEN